MKLIRYSQFYKKILIYFTATLISSEQSTSEAVDDAGNTQTSLQNDQGKKIDFENILQLE